MAIASRRSLATRPTRTSPCLTSPPPAHPRSGPHPRRQGHRAGQAPLQAVRGQPRMAEIVMLAHDLIVWTQALLLDGELTKAEFGRAGRAPLSARLTRCAA